MSKIVQAFLLIAFDSTDVFNVVLRTLYIAGVWMLLKKSGLKGWWALIPGFREYQLARSAIREPEGRVYSIMDIAIVFCNVIMLFVKVDSGVEVALALFLLPILFTQFIYGIRIWSGVIQNYGLRKRWLWLCAFGFSNWIPALLWGFSKKYQPQLKVEDIRAEMARLATSGSAVVMDEGLTVNLTERTAREFFQKKVLLRDIHMSIPQGHLVLLLGGSGAGKTTFVNAINGYEKADAEVVLNGSNMYTQYKKMQYEVGFVPQGEMMRSYDTVYNTLMDAAKLRLPQDVSRKHRKDRVEEVMEIFGIQPVKNNLVEKLSGGQKKRLSISMEFISNPSLFILDEPDSGLDGVMARELFVQLRKIADTGKIVIVITHTPDRVIDLFDDVIVLAKDSARTGRLAFYGSIPEAREFFRRDTMEQIVKSVNRKEEGGDGLADEYVKKYAEVQHG